MMSDTLAPLIGDFLEWLAVEPRRYAEVMEVWRTSCPRLTVWEDACDLGLVAHRHTDGDDIIAVTPLGQSWLAAAKGKKESASF